MSNTIRIKRRLAGGAAGAPSSLKTGEPAYNEQDSTLYYGYGDAGGGTASSVIPIGGKGAFVDLGSAQTITGAKTIQGGSHTAMTAFGIRSTGASFDVKLASSEAITADRTVTVVLGDASRTLTFAGNATISGTNSGDQTITLTGDVTGSGTGSFAATVGKIGGYAVSIGAAFTMSGAYAFTGTLTGITSVTFPTSGVLATTGNINSALPSGSASQLYVGTGSAGGAAVVSTLPTGAMPALTGDVTNSAGSLSTAIASNAVTNAKFRQSAALSVVGNSTNATANVADISSSGSKDVLRNTGSSAIGFGTIDHTYISDFDTQVRTSRLDQMATPTANVAFGGMRITGLSDPSSAGDAATKNYVDAVATGLNVKNAVRLATTGALAANSYSNGTSGVGATLTASSNGALSIDGTSPSVGDRILVKNEATGANNGIYTVTQVGDASHPYILTRATDSDQAAEVGPGLFVFVEQGTTNGATGWIIAAQGAITIGSTSITFTQFSAAASYSADESSLHLSGTTFSIKSTWAGQTAITTLGTITTGVWNATKVALAYGGTNTDLSGWTDGSLVMKSGTGVAAAVAGTDYLSPSSTIDGGTF